MSLHLSKEEISLLEKGEIAEDDLVIANNMSNGYVEEQLEEYKQFVLTEKQSQPLHGVICKGIMEKGYLLSFVHSIVNATVNLKIMQVIVILDALQRYADYNKYLLADANINGFDLDPQYQRAVIIDITIIEDLYNQFYDMLDGINTTFVSQIEAGEVRSDSEVNNET